MVDVNKEIIFRQIGAKIAYYRSLRNLTQVQLANLINISESTLSRFKVDPIVKTIFC